MINNKQIIAIIPARGGSKNIPRKNIKIIAGKPLIVWSIEAAKNSKYIDRVIVSTEDKEIAEVSKDAGAEVLDRPEELATDTATTIAVMQHAIKNIKGDVFVLLQPTSPIRINNLIDKAIEKFIESGADTLATGRICKDYEWGTVNNIPRQKLTGWFYDDGNVYVHKPEHLKEGKWTGKKLGKMMIDQIYNYEIDSPLDFYIVECLMGRFLKEKKKSKNL